MPHSEEILPEGVFSLLDTDLYKLTMQCAILKYFPTEDVTYAFTNRTPAMRLTRAAFVWLKDQIHKLGNITLSSDELDFLKTKCTYLSDPYLTFLSTFRFKPAEQIDVSFSPLHDGEGDHGTGDVHLAVKGLWLETILYEIPLLALISEAYFKFCDTDWDYEGQEEKSYRKARALLQKDCIFSEFGSRRRRDYHTQDQVLKGLCRARHDGDREGLPGKWSGTSNVHFAMMYDTNPVGTVAHEWFMGIASITDDYENANETALRYWLACFGEGILGIALTDTFGTPAFCKAFAKPIPIVTAAGEGAALTLPSATASTTVNSPASLAGTDPSSNAPLSRSDTDASRSKTYAEAFTGVRQDSGNPADFVKVMRRFYDSQGITSKKTMVFSDSLNVELCLEYKQVAEDQGFLPTFGVGTFFTNDFAHKSNGKKSVPLNIVIKLSSAGNRPSVKISDNIGKNTGDSKTVEEVKLRLGYVEKEWRDGDERTRWGKEE